MTRIPLAYPDLSGDEEANVVDAIRSSWVSSTGPYLSRFEAEFAELCGVKHAVAVANGTLALHLALLGLDVRPGDEVLVPALTYVATANAVRHVGAEPVFVDVDPHTWCIDPAAIEGAITRRTRGILPVHAYGHPADFDAIARLAAPRGLWVLEDAAEAHLARYKGRPVGGLGDLATFSFFGNKIFTCGEGGVVTLDDAAMATRLRTLRSHGADPERRYYFPVTGYNFRLTNVAAAMLCAQLARREAILARRREIFAAYRAGLGGVRGLSMQPIAPWAEAAPWLFCVTVDEGAFGLSRDALIARLDREGVETRPFFIPLHTLPPFREESRRRGESMPVSERLAATGINLPTFNALTTAQVERVCGVIRDASSSR